MAIREGTIPTVMGAAAASVGAAMAVKRVAPKIAAGIVGFGAAHIILGTVDLVQHKRFWE